MPTEHGTFKLRQVGRVVIIDSSGPFNDTIVAKYDKDIQKYMDRLMGQDWAMCDIFRKEGMFIPEAEDELRVSTLRHQYYGMKFSAIVLDNVNDKIVLKEQMARVYTNAGIDFAFFDTEEEAYIELVKRGYMTREELEESG